MVNEPCSCYSHLSQAKEKILMNVDESFPVMFSWELGLSLDSKEYYFLIPPTGQIVNISVNGMDITDAIEIDIHPYGLEVPEELQNKHKNKQDKDKPKHILNKTTRPAKIILKYIMRIRPDNESKVTGPFDSVTFKFGHTQYLFYKDQAGIIVYKDGEVKLLRGKNPEEMQFWQ